MRTYRIVWGAVTALVGMSAALNEAMSGGALRLALLAPIAAVLGGLLALVVAEERPDRWAWAARGAVWTGGGATVADALTVSWGVTGAVVGLVVLGGAPPLLVLVRRLFLRWTTRAANGPPEDLSTRDLLRRWEWTTTEVLSDGTTLGRRLALVDERRCLLDEIERRDPLRFDDWLVSAVPDGGPHRTRGGGERPWRDGW